MQIVCHGYPLLAVLEIVLNVCLVLCLWIYVSSLPVTARDIAMATSKDRLLAVVLQSVHHGQWSMPVSEGVIPFHRRRTKLHCQDGCILWGQRVVVPKVLQSCLLQELHEGHLGICRMKALERSYIWWPSLD